MPTMIPIIDSSLVNYTNLPTQASNELYQAETESPESIAFLMKNNVIIQYSLLPEPEEKEDSKKDDSNIVAIDFLH